MRESSCYFGYDVAHSNAETPRNSECGSGGSVFTIVDDNIMNPYYGKENKNQRNVALENVTSNPYYGEKDFGQKNITRNLMFVQKSVLNPYYIDKD